MSETATEQILVCQRGFVTGNRVVRKGETFAASHPLVQGREVNFRDLNDRTQFGSGTEAATAGPGEKRSTPPTPRTPPASKTPTRITPGKRG